MTPDDVEEVMARAAYGAMGFVDPWDSLVPHIKAKWRRAALAAYREARR